MNEFICVANCPELDLDNAQHCKCADPKERCELYPYSGECPCGNTPIWVNMEEFQ